MIIEALKNTRTAQVPNPDGRIRPREYAHIVLKTARAADMIDWYCKVLGMSVVLRTPIISFLTWDESQDRLAIIEVPADAAPDPARSALHHVAFTYDRLSDTVAVYRALAKEGILPHWCVNHGVATSYYYRDPDGNSVELSVENFRNVGDLNDWLASGDFNLNPVGVTLDADALALRVERGEPEAHILRPHPDHATNLEAEIARDAQERAARVGSV